MTGPQHFSKAEELAAKAHELLGQGEGHDTAAVWAAVAQVHAILAGVALAALGPDREREAWREALMACRLHDIVLAGDPPTVVLLHQNQHLRDAHLAARHAGDASVEVDNGDIRAEQAELPHRQGDRCSREDPLKSLLGGTNDLIAAQIDSAVGIGKSAI